jgi:Secretion system C-terminal sorting domain
MKFAITFFLLFSYLAISAQSSSLQFENQNYIFNHLLIDSSTINTSLKKNGKSHLSYINHVVDGNMIFMLMANIDDFGSGFLVEKIDLDKGAKVWQTKFDLRDDVNHHFPNHIFINKAGHIEVLSYRRKDPINPVIGWFKGTFSRHIINTETGGIVSHDFGDPALPESASLLNLYSGTKIRPLDNGMYQYYYLGSNQATQTDGCSNTIFDGTGKQLSTNTYDFNLQLDKLLYSSIYGAEITVLEYYVEDSTEEFQSYISRYNTNWNKFDEKEIVLNTTKPNSAYLVQDVNGEFVIETYIESDMGKRAYKIFYFDHSLNLKDEIVLNKSFQYTYVSTVLNNNKGRLAVRSLPVIKDGIASCLTQIYLSKGSQDVLLKEFFVVGKNYWVPQFITELENGQILVLGFHAEIADNSGNGKLGTAESIVMKLDAATLGITATNDLTEKDQIKIFPNPASSTLYLDTKSFFDHAYIYSLSGNLMATYYNVQNLDISKLPQGMYILAAFDPKSKIEKRVKFIKY